jgi:uncharacterized protein YndB with AHSA1/START domain
MTAEPIADGLLETHDDGTAVIRFERHLAHPVERVWTALTNPAEMARWWGEGDVDLVEGGRFTVAWQNNLAGITGWEPIHERYVDRYG